MHSLTICFGPIGTIWTLLFKTEERAAAAYENILRTGVPEWACKDDFGQSVLLVPDQIHGVMLEDMDASQMAQIERGLHQARTQAKAETRAMSDETIKGAMRAKQMGPAVMSPIPGGRFNG